MSKIRAVTPEDGDWIRKLLRGRWGSSIVVTRGRIHHADQLPGLISFTDNRPRGLITYRIVDDECEIITVDAVDPGQGIGKLLIASVLELARSLGCRRAWLITTNDNIPALHLYQKLGFKIVNVYHGAIREYRKLKPEIPETGYNGIPITDEIELEINFRPGASG